MKYSKDCGTLPNMGAEITTEHTEPPTIKARGFFIVSGNSG
jgi:hypothetical protein